MAIASLICPMTTTKHIEAIKIVKETCEIDYNGDINCGNCKYFGNCKLDEKYGKHLRNQMLTSYTNPLNR